MILLAAIVAALASAHLDATPASPAAQAAVDRGLFLYYAYDGDDAAAAFASAAATDPQLAIAAWGQALALGPDLNTPLTEENFTRAQSAIEQAVRLESSASPLERGLIDAMAARYRGSWDDRERDDAQYRTAMVALAAQTHNENAELLAAEALLEHSGMVWNDTVPATDDSRTVLAFVDDVLGRDPTQPMANHLCIHIYDNATDRSPALSCAQRLDAATFPPQAEHLAHMPAHYWIETGNYAAAVASSQRAYDLLLAWDSSANRSLADQRYGGHDLTVGYSAAMMLGNYALAQTWSARLDQLYRWKFEALTALRFGRYQDAIDAAGSQFLGLQVRGLALLHLKRFADAQAVAVQLRREFGDPRGDLAQMFLARLAEAQGNDREARSWLDRARDTQHANYGSENIPFIPAEEALGGYLLHRGAYADAERAFTEALTAYPNDPRALFGLAAALDGEGRGAQATQTRALFARQWAGADTTLLPADL